jgi:hypothetical protein
MQRHIFIWAIALTLVLAIGLGVFAQGGDVGKMPTAAAGIDLSPSVNCQISCDQEPECFDACYTVSVLGLETVPVSHALLAFGVVKFDALARDAHADRPSAPDPHPPKRPSRT